MGIAAKVIENECGIVGRLGVYDPVLGLQGGKESVPGILRMELGGASGKQEFV